MPPIIPDSKSAKNDARLRRIGKHFKGFKKNGQGYVAFCPAHDDSTASLSLNEGKNGRVLLHCHAGCDPSKVLSRVSLTFADLGPNRRHIVATYDYVNAAGKLLYQVARYEPKDFRQRRPKPSGGWEWSVKGIKRVPYRLPELLAADKTETVFIPEGERDADRLAGLGLVATTNAGGAGKWLADSAKYLRGRHVVILPDNDEAGRNHADDVACKLCGVAASARYSRCPACPRRAT